jgi:hypothetical protein
LHIDSDWKKQAQEEKRRLAEEQAKRAAAPPAAPPAAGAPAGARPGAGRAPGKGKRELPAPTLGTLVQSIVTQVLYYLGDLSSGGGEPMVNLDMAKHQIDTLGMLEEKTKGNLTPEETQLLDAALYEVRMRYVNVASQYI